ncbi:MAG: hypothetical protein J5695_04880 [Bacteroidales bacterium]|nr:hypothetical protein [Bacteroidales bacterium]
MKRILLASLVFLALSGTALAQEFRTGYFLENYSYAYRINPAAPIEGKPYFFGGIGLGNVSAEVHTNLSVPSFLTPLTFEDGTSSLVLPLLRSEFSLEEALAGFSVNNELLANANVNLLTVGYQSDVSRWSVELNLRADAYAGMPLDIFSALKTAQLNGISDWHDRYSFAGFCLEADSYTELALGYSRRIGDQLTVGGRVKGLFGLGYTGINIDASIAPGVEKDVKLGLDASLNVSSPVDMSLPTSTINGKRYYDFSQVDFADFAVKNIFGTKKSLAGWGLGFDLGVTYEPIEGLYISAAANDLGFLSWKGNVGAAWHIDSEIGEDWREFLRLEDTSGRFTSGLNYSINAGVKYKMPFYDRLSVGLLGTFQKNYKEARLGIDITPLDFISIAATGAIGTMGGQFGAALNLKFPIVNFFIGTDAFLYNFTPEMIPLDKINTMITTGLLIAI